ncbi:extracellular solute-binding protein [Acetatifactor muris]|uniref:extracellular solute-binding protein n=1 Tax=Acetatifactor muris TaxID=879566 RepID=UPI0023F0AD66|nr:extracellular solute-binding protein [Acetatifactor muris]
MKKKRLLPLLLAGTLLLTACGNGDSGSSEASVDNSGSAAVFGESGNGSGETSGAGEENGSGESFTITMMQELFTDQAPDTTNQWYQKMEEMTGVKMEVNFVPTLSYVDKITAFIASKSLPMVFTANGNVLRNNNLLMALDSDGFWALDDYIKDYPELYNFVGEQVWENSKVHGKIYGIPRLRILPRNGLIIRQDWLDALNLEMPETFDELYEVAKAFTENDPDGNGQNDTVGIVTAYQGVGNRGWNGFQTLATAFGAPNGWAYQDGTMVPDFGTQEYMTALKYIKKLYDDGYMNKDFAEINAQARYENFDKGTYGMVFGVIDDVNARNVNLPQVVEGAVATVVPALHEEGKEPRCNATAGYNGIIMFTKFGDEAIKTEEDLRKILSYYNTLATQEIQDMTLYGIEGVHYEVKDGKRELIMNESSNSAQLTVDMGDIGQILMSAAYMRKDSDTEIQTALYDTIEEREAYCVTDASIGLESETYDDVGSDLDAIMMDAAVKFVIGSIDEDGYWKEYDNWLKRGGEDVIKEFTAQYEEYKK